MFLVPYAVKSQFRQNQAASIRCSQVSNEKRVYRHLEYDREYALIVAHAVVLDASDSSFNLTKHIVPCA
jgi:hypothetical protein